LEKSDIEKHMDELFGKFDKTFNQTFNRGDELLRIAEQKLHNKKERLRKKMEETSQRIRLQERKINEKMNKQNIESKKYHEIESLNRNLYIKILLTGLVLTFLMLFSLLASIIINNSNNDTSNKLLQPSIEETITPSVIDKKL
jgi:hypothetical protein